MILLKAIELIYVVGVAVFLLQVHEFLAYAWLLHISCSIAIKEYANYLNQQQLRQLEEYIYKKSKGVKNEK